MTTPIAGGPSPVAAQHAALRKTAQQLEAVFYAQLLQSMRETVPEGMVERSQGEQMFTGMLDQELARVAAERGEGGLSEALYRQLRRFLPPIEAPSEKVDAPAS